jgi:hypothetical protein
VPTIGGSTFSTDDVGRVRTASACPDAPAGSWNSFSLHLDLPANPTPEKVEVIGLAVNGSEPAGARDAFRLAPGSGLQKLLEVLVCVDVARLRTPGTWSVLGLLRWTASGLAERSFAFSVVRRPAVLQIPAGFTLLVGDDGKFHPAGIPIQETGGETGIAALAAVADPVETSSTVAELNFRDPVRVAPHGSAQLLPQLSGELPLGASTTRIVLSAPELGLPVSTTVRMVFRRCVGWLGLSLFVGVVSGFVLRVMLAGWQAKTISRVAAAEEAERIVAIAEEDKDPMVRQTLMRTAGALMAEAREALLARTIDDALTRRRKEADEIVVDTKTRRLTLRERIDHLVSVYDPPAGFDRSVAVMAEPVQTKLATLAKTWDEGSLFAAEAQTDLLQRAIPAELAPRLKAWRTTLIEALRTFNNWPLTADPTQQAEALIAACDRVDTLDQANEVAGQIRNWLDHHLPKQTAEELRTVAHALREAGFVNAADSLNVASAAFDRSAGGFSTSAQLAAIILEAAQRREMVAETIHSWSPANAGLKVWEELKAGRLPEAVAALGPPPGTSGPINIQAPLSPIRLAAAGAASVLPIVLPLHADYMIAAPTLGTRGVAINLQLIMPQPQSGVQPAIIWSGEGVTADVTEPKKAVLQADRIGFHDVTASINGVVVARTTVSISGEVRRRHLMREKALGDAIGTALSGLVAMCIGWIVFEPGWVGAARDVVGAFLWAFTLDLGLSRVRDIAAPLISRPAPG